MPDYRSQFMDQDTALNNHGPTWSWNYYRDNFVTGWEESPEEQDRRLEKMLEYVTLDHPLDAPRPRAPRKRRDTFRVYSHSQYLLPRCVKYRWLATLSFLASLTAWLVVANMIGDTVWLVPPVLLSVILLFPAFFGWLDRFADGPPPKLPKKGTPGGRNY